MPEFFRVSDIVTNARTQCRTMDRETVERYAGILGESEDWPFPALKLTYDDETYYLASGFHRLAAAKVHEMPEVPVDIFAGGVSEAFRIGLQDNQGPKSLTPADRQTSIVRLLQDDNGLSYQGIAELCGCSKRTVYRIKADLDKPARDSVTSTPVQQNGDAGCVTEDAGTDATRREAPPPPDRERRTEGGGGSSLNQDTVKPQKDPVKLQKAKTVKTAEALMRAFGDLDDLKSSKHYDSAIASCQNLLALVQNWT